MSATQSNILDTTEQLPPDSLEVTKEESRSCVNCGGSGKVGNIKCMPCKGTGSFDRPDFGKIYQLIKGRTGVRQNPPSNDRAFYVWRMVKFHAGLDVKLPIEAIARVAADPWVDDLEQAAEYLARMWYGTASAGVSRWGPLLGLLDPDQHIPDQPTTAYTGGPTNVDTSQDAG